jgi:hypothetical protein
VLLDLSVNASEVISNRTWQLKHTRKRTCEHLAGSRDIVADDRPSLYLDRAALHFNLGPCCSFGQHTEITLQDVPKPEYTLRLLVESRDIELQRKDNRTWTQSNARMSLVSPLRIPNKGCSYVEMFLQHPRCARRSKRRVVISFGQKTDRGAT